MQFYENLLGRRAAGRSVILSAGHQALAARSGIQLRLVPSPRGVFVGVGVCGSMSVQQVSGVPWGWHRGAKMRFELEWGGSWDRASAERSAIAACQRRTRKGRDGRGRSRLRCHRHLFADFLVGPVQDRVDIDGNRLGDLVTPVCGSRTVWVDDVRSPPGKIVSGRISFCFRRPRGHPGLENLPGSSSTVLDALGRVAESYVVPGPRSGELCHIALLRVHKS